MFSMGLMGGRGGSEDDPYMNPGNAFSQMDNMMNSMMSFGNPFMAGPQGFPSIMGPPRSQAMMPHGGGDPFGMMMGMNFSNAGNNVHSYSSSSVMSMTTGPDGRPQVYQSSSSSRCAPGGVKETHRSVSDSNTGLRKMAIGHHLGERGHVIEKEVNNGELTENQEFINLEEEEANTFDAEFRHRAQSGRQPHSIEGRTYSSRPTASPSRSRQRYLPALPAASSSRAEERPRQRDRHSNTKSRRF